jgi:hypothetical protein
MPPIWPGKPPFMRLVVGRSFCYKWLLADGFTSRMKKNKRKHSPEVMEAALAKFIWMQEACVFRNARLQ